MLKGRKLHQAIREFVEVYSKRELGLSPKTLKNKRNAMRRLFRFLNGRPLTLQTYRAYIQSLESWRPSSVTSEVKIGRAFVRFLHRRKYIDDDFARELATPKREKRRINVIPFEKAVEVIEAGTTPGKYDNSLARRSKKLQRVGMRFMLFTGLRVSELLRLRGKDFNLSNESFWVKRKGGNDVQLPIPRNMIKEIKPLLKKEAMFPLDPKTMNINLKRGCKKLEVHKITCHVLRHVYATHKILLGYPLQYVSKMLSHSNIQITNDFYSHFNLEDLRQVANNDPMVYQGMTPQETLDSVQRLVERGLRGDDRFEIKRTSGSISVHKLLSPGKIPQEKNQGSDVIKSKQYSAGNVE